MWAFQCNKAEQKKTSSQSRDSADRYLKVTSTTLAMTHTLRTAAP